jgi:hypothetical protein
MIYPWINGGIIMSDRKLALVGIALIGIAALHGTGTNAKPKTHAHVAPAPGYYFFDHAVVRSAGRSLIYKECPIDMAQDPCEVSCKIWWAYI